jgi:hypothetical protein
MWMTFSILAHFEDRDRDCVELRPLRPLLGLAWGSITVLRREDQLGKKIKG